MTTTGELGFSVKAARWRVVVVLTVYALILLVAAIQVIYGPFDLGRKSEWAHFVSFVALPLFAYLISTTIIQMRRFDSFIAVNGVEIRCHSWSRAVRWNEVSAVEAHKGPDQFHFAFVLGDDGSGEREKLTCSIPRTYCEFDAVVAGIRPFAQRNSVPLYSA